MVLGEEAARSSSMSVWWGSVTVLTGVEVGAVASSWVVCVPGIGEPSGGSTS